MKKIGIITFHRAKNYGAKLQAYALQEVLKEKYIAEIIDYRNNRFERLYYQRRNVIEKVIRGLLFPRAFLHTKKRDSRFLSFDKECLKTNGFVYSPDNITDASTLYDCFISGSDQVWCLKLTDHDWNYLLEFAEIYQRYSYAASFGSRGVDEHDLNRFAEDLRNYQSLLVREPIGKALIQELTGKKAIVVADPVFLLDKEEWKRKLCLKEDNNKNYIVVLIVEAPEYALNFAVSLSEQLNTRICFINFKGNRKIPKGFINVDDAGPIEFLQYILNARAVVTTSFHALAFSIIFNVPVYYELGRKKESNNSRLENIGNLFNLTDNEIKSRSIDRIEPIKWGDVNKTLYNYRLESKKALFDSLSG